MGHKKATFEFLAEYCFTVSPRHKTPCEKSQLIWKNLNIEAIFDFPQENYDVKFMWQKHFYFKFLYINFLNLITFG